MKRDSSIDRIRCDVLVIGSGAAGLRSAIEVARLGKKVLIACKSNGGRGTSTHIANGGFRVSREGFTREDHFEMIMKSGRFINSRKRVEVLVDGAPAAFEELKSWGVKFQYDGPMPAFPGGKAIIQALEGEAARLGIETISSIAIVRLLRDAGRVCGALAFDLNEGCFKALLATAVILATGGAGALYSFCDNPPHATGDGYILGLEAGARLIDMEFVQFYPLGAFQPGRTALLFPPVFGNLGVIRNAQSEDIYQKHGITQWPAASLARDMTSRALYSEIDRGADVGGALLLDLRDMSEDDWQSSQGVLEKRPYYRRRFNCDEEPLPIIPVSHYTMGGIVTDLWGATGVEGLFAAGEASGGTHGANRIGGNAIPESLVFGARAGGRAVASIDEYRHPESEGRVIEEAFEGWRDAFGEGNDDPHRSGFIQETVRKTVWEKVGVIRNAAGLREAVATFEMLERDHLPELRAETPKDFLAMLEAKSLLLIAKTAATFALGREESRGAHFRSDLPEENDEKGIFNHCASFAGGELCIEKIPVSE